VAAYSVSVTHVQVLRDIVLHMQEGTATCFLDCCIMVVLRGFCRHAQKILLLKVCPVKLCFVFGVTLAGYHSIVPSSLEPRDNPEDSIQHSCPVPTAVTSTGLLKQKKTNHHVRNWRMPCPTHQSLSHMLPLAKLGAAAGTKRHPVTQLACCVHQLFRYVMIHFAQRAPVEALYPPLHPHSVTAMYPALGSRCTA
jgi:hypothetical protein